MIVEGVAYIPEIKLENEVTRKIKVTSNIFILPESNKHAVKLKESIKKNGDDIENGVFLYYKGEITDDGTIYEIFQSYGLALTFYYEGRATCRAYQEIRGDKYGKLELFIDEYDRFAHDPDDARTIKKADRKKIALFYDKIVIELSSNDYNPLVNSLDFFNRFLKEPDIKIRLLYLNICLESIFVAESDAEGLSFKLGLRCAHFLDKNSDDMDKSSIFLEVKNGYNLRSKIIHGGNYVKESERIIRNSNNSANSEIDHSLFLEEILKRAYKVIFGITLFYENAKTGNLGKEIDERYIII